MCHRFGFNLTGQLQQPKIIKGQFWSFETSLVWAAQCAVHMPENASDWKQVMHQCSGSQSSQYFCPLGEQWTKESWAMEEFSSNHPQHLTHFHSMCNVHFSYTVDNALSMQWDIQGKIFTSRPTLTAILFSFDYGLYYYWLNWRLGRFSNPCKLSRAVSQLPFCLDKAAFTRRVEESLYKSGE